MLLGAMVASATLHGTGLVHGRLPPLLVTLGFVTVGAMIGVRFRGTRLAEARRTLPGAMGSILLALVVSALFTGLGSLLLGLPFSQLWIAYAPGAVEAMAAIALALGFDPAFVGAHHILRILALNLTSPLILRRPRPRRHEGRS
jgi:membrane AbrB-like protein